MSDGVVTRHRPEDILNRVFDENNNLLNVAASVTIDTSLLATAAKQDTIIGHVDGIEGLLTTIDTDTGNIATSVSNIDSDTSNIQTAVQIMDDWDATAGSAHPSDGVMAMGSDGTNARRLKTDTSGELQVDVLTMPTVAVTQSGTWDEVGINDSGNVITVDGSGTAGSAASGVQTIQGIASMTPVQVGDNNSTLSIDDGSGAITVDNGGTFVVQESGSALTALQLIDDVVYTDDTSTHSTGSSKGALMMAAATPTDTAVNANDIGALAMTVNRELLVQVNTSLPAGTNAIGKLAANSGVDIGDVDITSIAAGNNNIGDVDIASGTITTVSTVTALGTGTTGPMKAEDAAHNTGDQGFPAWGVRQDTPNATFAASNDYHFLSTDMVGGIRTALYETDFAVLGTNHVKKYYTNSGAVTDGIIWSPAAGKRWYVTDIFINTSAAATITLEDDKAGGDEAVWKMESAANSGWSHHFGTPLFSGEDAADLMVTTSTGNVYVTVTGYEI